MPNINLSSLGGVNMAMPSCTQGLPNPGAASSTPDNNDLFYLELKYDQLVSGLPGVAQQNGNISQMLWRVRGRERQVYGFEYDAYDRLKKADYVDYADSGSKSTNNRFGSTYGYDVRGNISTITRNGQYWDGSCRQVGQIDNLGFSYWNTDGKTNRLQKVTDNASASIEEHGFKPGGGGDYTYDSNGNLIFDPNKNINIQYNYLNLPKRIQFEDCQEIEFLYDAAGAKLRKLVKDGSMVLSTHDYIGGMEYKNEVLEAIYHSEGRVYFEDGTGRYEYTITDHPLPAEALREGGWAILASPLPTRTATAASISRMTR